MGWAISGQPKFWNGYCISAATISSGNLSLDYKLNLNSKNTYYEIKDSGGKNILKLNLENGYGIHKAILNCSKYPNGLYFIKIYTTRPDNNQDIVIKKFVIKK
jgi:hypothetical protein